MGLKVCQLCAVDFTLKHFLLPLIDGMKNAGWEVTAVCSDGPAIVDLRMRGYSIETIHIERSFNLLKHFSSIIKLVRFFKASQFDVVHVHTPVAALVGRIAAKLANVPTIVYTAHGFYFHDEMPTWKRHLFIWLEKFGGLFTDILFTQSTEDAQTAKSEHIVKPDNILAIGNGVCSAHFDPEQIGDGTHIRYQLGIPPEAFVIGIVARMVQEKGINDFLHAATNAASKNQNLYFLMVGERLHSDHAGDVTKQLTEAAHLLGDRLLTTGIRSDIAELLSAMDVFCLPSWREGMPRTIIEAMMMGKAVIATDIRGSREEVIAGKTGLLVPIKSPEILEKAFLELSSNHQKVIAMGIASRKRALEVFDEYKVVSLQISRISSFISAKAKYV